LEEVSTVTR